MELELTTANIKLIAKKLDLSIGDFVHTLGLKAFTSLVFKTPVGNPTLWKSKAPKGYVGGRAKFSWNMQYKRPNTKQPLNWSGGLPPTPSIKINTNYEPLFVTSPVPYMERLEKGWSTQGSHMIKRTVSEINLELKTAIR